MRPDEKMLERLVEFARIEIDSADIEPWAAILADLHEQDELSIVEAHWAVKLYNAYDSLGSAFGVLARWGDIEDWSRASDRLDAALFECTQERRSLRGGRVVKHLFSYHEALAGMPAEAWLRQPLMLDDPGKDFDRLTAWVRQVWGVGRQTAFEWAEFVAKVRNFPIDADNAQLWESEGPRRSLQRLYGNDDPSPEWLDEVAHACRGFLRSNGVDLAWVDFETVICDFNVMRDGRYYPGRHLAALREEIDGMPSPWREKLDAAWHRIIPDPWVGIAPGIDPTKKPIFAQSGRIICEP